MEQKSTKLIFQNEMRPTSSRPFTPSDRVRFWRLVRRLKALNLSFLETYILSKVGALSISKWKHIRRAPNPFLNFWNRRRYGEIAANVFIHSFDPDFNTFTLNRFPRALFLPETRRLSFWAMARCANFAKRTSKSDSAQKFAPWRLAAHFKGWPPIFRARGRLCDEKKSQN